MELWQWVRYCRQSGGIQCILLLRVSRLLGRISVVPPGEITVGAVRVVHRHGRDNMLATIGLISHSAAGACQNKQAVTGLLSRGLSPLRRTNDKRQEKGSRMACDLVTRRINLNRKEADMNQWNQHEVVSHHILRAGWNLNARYLPKVLSTDKGS